VINVLAQVQYLTVQQMLLYALAIVMSVLVQAQHITVQLTLPYVLATVMSVLVQVPHITAQQVMLFAQILLLHVTVQVVVQYLIVNHALTLMVHAELQLVAVMFVEMKQRHIMVYNAQLVNSVVVALVLLSLLEPRAMAAQQLIIDATEAAGAQCRRAALPVTIRQTAGFQIAVELTITAPRMDSQVAAQAVIH